MSHTTKTELADIIARSFSEAVGKEIAALPVDKQTAAADMALAGVASFIPVDEVIEAMDRIGRAIPKSLRETSEAGLAVTKTAKAVEKKIYG